jgi:hypothetical protein
MGIDPNAKPDFFLDLDEVEEFIKEHEKVTPDGRVKYLTANSFIFIMLFIALCAGAGALGYLAGGDLLEYWMNKC